MAGSSCGPQGEGSREEEHESCGDDERDWVSGECEHDCGTIQWNDREGSRDGPGDFSREDHVVNSKTRVDRDRPREDHVSVRVRDLHAEL